MDGLRVGRSIRNHAVTYTMPSGKIEKLIFAFALCIISAVSALRAAEGAASRPSEPHLQAAGNSRMDSVICLSLYLTKVSRVDIYSVWTRGSRTLILSNPEQLLEAV